MGMMIRSGTSLLLYARQNPLASIQIAAFHNTRAPTRVQRLHRRHFVVCATSNNAATSLFQDMNDGKKKKIAEKAVRREARIDVLEKSRSRTPAENAELKGLNEKSTVFEEQYDPALFSPEHAEFKQQHNRAFGKLVQYIQNKQHGAEPVNVFFLDGPDAGTAMSLHTEAGIPMNQLFVANRHASTCQVLRETYWTVVEHYSTTTENVVHNSAAAALGDEFRNVPFGAYYFDGCGGHVPMILEMIEAAFASSSSSSSSPTNITNNIRRPMVIGFSVLGGGRDIVDKETSILRAIVQLAKPNGLQVRHVMDDPFHYGVDPSLSKLQGGTFTSWVVLE